MSTTPATITAMPVQKSGLRRARNDNPRMHAATRLAQPRPEERIDPIVKHFGIGGKGPRIGRLGQQPAVAFHDGKLLPIGFDRLGQAADAAGELPHGRGKSARAREASPRLR